jgi:hypothetical protein
MSLIERVCHICKKTKLITEFYRDKKLPLGYAYRCKECAKKHAHEWYLNNRQKCIEYSKLYVKTHNEQHKKINRNWWKNHPEQTAKYRRTHRDKLRLEVLTHYGGNPPKCACCGEDHILFLTLDHINNNGREERRKVLGKSATNSTSFYAWLIKNNFPEDYQVLCFNCNCGRFREHKDKFCSVHHPIYEKARFLPC